MKAKEEERGWTGKKVGELFGLTHRTIHSIDENVHKQIFVIYHCIGRTIVFI